MAKWIKNKTAPFFGFQEGFTPFRNLEFLTGFTLIETIVAIFLITVGIVGAFTLITYTVSSTTFSTQKLIASYLAQEGIEIVRNIRDTNWLEDGATLWNAGLTTTCSGTCDETTGNGCIADYTYSTIRPPSLPQYTGQVLNIDNNGYYSYSTIPPFTLTKFKRKIVITSAGDILAVCVRVEWEEKGKTYSVSAQENLYNWKQ